MIADVNWLAVLVATLASFGIGAVWYSPVMFSRVWQREAAVSEEKMASANMGMIFGGAFVLIFLSALAFALLLGPRPDLFSATTMGFAAGLFLVAASLGVNYLFERRSLKLWLINGGYNIATFTAIGAILGTFG